MPRIRTIKPEFFQHERLFDAEKETSLPLRVAFAGLWTVADRAGRFEWRTRQLKINILPYDELNFDDVLSALEKHGFIERYEVAGRSYGCIPSWSEHQHINVREPHSTIPAPDASGECTGQVPDGAGTGTGEVPDQSAGKGKEGKGREGKGSDALTRALTVAGICTSSFSRWVEYRIEIKKPLKPTSLQAAAEELAKFGEDQAAVVQQSIANGWQGLFPLKTNGRGKSAPSPTLPPELRNAN